MSEHQQTNKDSRTKVHQETPKEHVTQDSAAPEIQDSQLDPSLTTPSRVLNLQRAIGNAAVQRLLAGKASQLAEQADDKSPVAQQPAASFVDSKLQRKPRQEAVQENNTRLSDPLVSGVEQLSRQSADDAAVDSIQRQFQPVTTNKNAHLRNDGQWGAHVGAKIDSGDEIVADPAQQKTQRRRVISDVTWTKAVNVSGADWTWATHNGRTTYIRNGSIGPAKQYPEKAETRANKPPRRASIDRPQLNWHHLTGEFVEIEDSVSTPGAKIAKHKNEFKRITPATGQIDALDANEQLQIDTPALEAYLLRHLEEVVRAGIGGLPWEDLLATEANLKKVMYAREPEGSKALRFDNFGKTAAGSQFVSYFNWVMAPDGPFQRIQEGAQYIRDSLEHWRKWLNPPNGDGVTITSINVNGSDLHEHGLGVLFVKFNKPAGGPAEYTTAGEHEVVVKPEERDLEQRLFGTQPGSLANFVNNVVGLAGPDQITTYKQKVAPGFGTLCEKVIATRAKDLPTDVVRPLTQALKESLVFVLMTGLTDLHGENILWRDGKPYMIDADNALKLKYMTPDQATAQSGYTAYSRDASPALTEVYNSSVGYETSLMEALQTPNSWAQLRILKKVKEIFAASIGRTVPIETGVWGNRLMSYIATREVGDPGDVPVDGVESTTKWQWCNYWATTVPTGRGANAPGLRGEVGVRLGTDGNFQPVAEAAQLFADFKVGQIPFYNYRYGDGYVLHNGQVVWHGQPIAERMEGLFALFPRQLNI
jgi:hypothetical protein